MHTKYSIVYDGRETKIVKNFSAITPNSDGAIFSYTLIIKSIDLGYLTTFMVTSNKSNSIRITNLTHTQEKRRVIIIMIYISLEW